MRTRVYLSPNDGRLPRAKEPPVRLRIQRRRTTVQDLHCRLQHAYRRAAARWVRRRPVGRALLGPPGFLG